MLFIPYRSSSQTARRSGWFDWAEDTLVMEDEPSGRSDNGSDVGEGEPAE